MLFGFRRIHLLIETFLQNFYLFRRKCSSISSIFISTRCCRVFVVSAISILFVVGVRFIWKKKNKDKFDEIIILAFLSFWSSPLFIFVFYKLLYSQSYFKKKKRVMFHIWGRLDFDWVITDKKKEKKGKMRKNERFFLFWHFCDRLADIRKNRGTL